MKLKASADGTITATTAELEEFAGEVIAATEKRIREAAANRPPGLDSQGLLGPEEVKQFQEQEGETRSHKSKRLKNAVIAVTGGRLAVEDAPKEIKMVRFLNAQANVKRDPDAAAVVKALSEGSATDGGNLTPVEFGTDLLVAIEEYGTVRRDAQIVPMTSNEIDLRTVTTKPVVARKGELVASDESLTKFGKPVLTCDMYTGKQVMSREVFDDNNVGLYQRLIDLFAEQFSYAEDYEGLVGTYYPGVLNSVTPVTTTLDGTSFADITYKKLVSMKNSLSRGRLARGGKWYMHRTIMGLIESLEDNQGRPIIQNPFGPTPPTLLGYPVELNEVMPGTDADAANTPFIIFGNLTWVGFGMRSGITVETLREGSLTIAGPTTVNLADQRAYGLVMDIRWGINVTIPTNLAIMKSKA